MAIFSRLVPSLVSAFGLQMALATVFVPLKTERFYDFSGAVGFLSTTYISLYYPQLRDRYWLGINNQFPPLSSFAPRQLVMTGMLSLWSLRLGAYLTQRILKVGEDSRFKDIKGQPGKFAAVWIAQGAWIALVGLPVFMANAIPRSAHPVLGMRDYAALGLYVTSFLTEVIADQQKSDFRAAKDAGKHNEKFITTGLWSISRHPNYVGEVGIWTAVWAMSTSFLQTPYFPKGAVALGAVSPLFTYLLVRWMSGVPLLEESGDKKFGDDPKWKEYKKTVPIFFPWAGYN